MVLACPDNRGGAVGKEEGNKRIGRPKYSWQNTICVFKCAQNCWNVGTNAVKCT